MILLHIISFILVFLWIGSTGPFLGHILYYGIDSLEDMFNPIAIYDNGDFNIFGAILLPIVSTVAFAPMAIIYWFYKLCTVGRR